VKCPQNNQYNPRDIKKTQTTNNKDIGIHINVERKKDKMRLQKKNKAK
jgi:hypothetical protein